MKRIMLAAVSFAVLFPGSAFALQEGQARVRVFKVSGPIYMIAGGGGNIGVSAGKDGVLLIDDQFAALADDIRAALADLVREANAATPSFILNTHWHPDHADGNEAFGAESPIIAHRNVRTRLSSNERLFGQRLPARPPHALPVITFDDSLSIHFNDEEIRVVHVPAGHTDGDAIVYFTDSKVVHMGDDFFNHMFPYIDLEHGGGVRGIIAAVDRVLATLPKDTRVIPGHGQLGDMDDLREYRAMLGASVETVERAMRSGRSRKEIIAAGLPEEWASWGQGFVDEPSWIELVHRSLEAENGD